MTQNTSYDLIVVGNGLAGGLCSLMAASMGLHVGLVDEMDTNAPLNDSRTSAIFNTSRRILDTYGLWSALEDIAFPIQEIRISQAHSTTSLNYKDQHALKNNSGALGFSVPNSQWKKILRQHINTSAHIHRHAPCAVTGGVREKGVYTVMLQNNHQLQAPLVIATDGKNSTLRRHLCVETFRKNYKQKAIVFNINHTCPHHHRAFEHFLPSGPLAVLPAGPQECAVVWVGASEEMDHFIALPEEWLLKAFQARFGYGLGKLNFVAPPQCYPLEAMIAKQCFKERVVFVGDAGHFLHPVSAQGLNLTLREIHRLLACVKYHKGLGLDWGAENVLEEFSKKNKKDVLQTAALTHGLVRVFSNNNSMAFWARKGGLFLCENIPSLKAFLLNTTT